MKLTLVEKITDNVSEQLLNAGCVPSKHSFVIAVSGGIDSMVLLDIFSFLGISGIVAHLDHGIRKNSTLDADFVRHEAQRRGYSTIVKCCDVPILMSKTGKTLEEAARDVRFSFLNRVAIDENAIFIALGHHLDDQAETILMRLIRSSGSGGLASMETLRDNKYVRPMLNLSREEIERYAKDRKVTFREDSTNLDKRFLRNRIRHELLPSLKEGYNPQIVDVLNRTATILRSENNFMEDIAQEAFDRTLISNGKTHLTLDVEVLQNCHIAIRRRILRNALIAIGPVRHFGGFDYIERLNLILSKNNKAIHQLGENVRVQNYEGRLFFRREPIVHISEYIAVPGNIKLKSGIGSLRLRYGSVDEFERVYPGINKDLAVFDASRLSSKILLRSIRHGDRFSPLGMNGRKKLSDFLIDEKFPSIWRDRVSVIESNGEIAWVVGLRSSEKFRVCDSTEQIVIAEFENDCNFGFLEP